MYYYPVIGSSARYAGVVEGEPRVLAGELAVNVRDVIGYTHTRIVGAWLDALEWRTPSHSICMTCGGPVCSFDRHQQAQRDCMHLGSCECGRGDT